MLVDSPWYEEDWIFRSSRYLTSELRDSHYNLKKEFPTLLLTLLPNLQSLVLTNVTPLDKVCDLIWSMALAMQRARGLREGLHGYGKIPTQTNHSRNCLKYFVGLQKCLS